MTTQINQEQVHITMNPALISLLGKGLYSRPLSDILPRELLQNSRDAIQGVEGGRINMIVEDNAGDLHIICDDNGVGMDKNILVNTFLDAGSTFKHSDNAVGGFGIAKVAIFCSNLWSVRTNNLHIDQTMTCSEGGFSRKGTVVDCTVSGKGHNEINARFMISSSAVKGLYLNGDRVPEYKGRRTLYDRNNVTISTGAPVMGNSNYVFYRINGLTQYYDRLGYGDDFGFNVIVDFDNIGYRPGADRYPFSMSREQVSDEWKRIVNDVVAPLAKNRLTSRTRHAVEKKSRKEKEPEDKIRWSSASHICMDGPKTLTQHQRRILILWENIITTMHPGRELKFGTVFTATTRAMRFSNHKGIFYLVNPVAIDGLIKEHSITLPDSLVMGLWHLATHEVTHENYSDHDEDFTSRESENAFETSMNLAKNFSSLKYHAKRVLETAE